MPRKKSKVTTEEFQLLLNDLEELRLRVEKMDKLSAREIARFDKQAEDCREAFEAELEGSMHIRNLYGAHDYETMFQFVERLYNEAKDIKKAEELLRKAQPRRWLEDEAYIKAEDWEDEVASFLSRNKCLSCNGEGTIRYADPQYGRAMSMTCDRCKGTGRAQ